MSAASDHSTESQPLNAAALAKSVAQYDKTLPDGLIQKAFDFAKKAHEGQTRASGEPYINHPIAVAGIALGLKLDGASIATALLHDVVEDCGISLNTIEEEFGLEIRRLVDGVTKLSHIKLKKNQTAAFTQAENFRKLVLAMSEDIRVLLVKLCDRLHNMRTLHYIPKEEKRRKISLETSEIFAPLAERLGMQKVYDELMKLSFIHLHPDAYEAISRRKKLLFEKKEDTVEVVINSLQDILQTTGVNFKVTGREKSSFSIWKKMKIKNLPFEQLSDIFAFRVIVDDVPQCYQVLGLIHSTYPVVPGRFKDYISTPKSNNYQSLHTCVIGPNQNAVEIQIRTKEMHQIAEMGVAAHWEYKQSSKITDHKTFKWLRELLDILEHSSTPEEFLENTKLEMYQDQVFCFTPKGEIVSLPNGATPVDLAYAIHSDVGNHCVGAKINGRIVPLRVVLQNGDQVEIISSKNHGPSPAWEKFVVTGKAKACIRKYIREKQKDQYVELGRNLLQMTFKAENVPVTNNNIDLILSHFDASNYEDLLIKIGLGRVTPPQVSNFLRAQFPKEDTSSEKKLSDNIQPSEVIEEQFSPKNKKNIEGKSLSIQGLIPGLAIHLAKCCHPLPGERIVGIIVTGKGVRIHTYNCPNLQQFSDSPGRWLDVQWSEESSIGQEKELFSSRLKLMLVNESSVFASVTNLIAKEGGNISNLKVVRRTTDYFDILIDVEVKNYVQLSHIVAVLRTEKRVMSVERS